MHNVRKVNKDVCVKKSPEDSVALIGFKTNGARASKLMKNRKHFLETCFCPIHDYKILLHR
jgi:hypothetical protein